MLTGALIKLFAMILLFSQKDVTSDLPDMAPRLQDIIRSVPLSSFSGVLVYLKNLVTKTRLKYYSLPEH